MTMSTFEELEDQLTQAAFIADQAKLALREAQRSSAKAEAEVHRLNTELRQVAINDLLAHGFHVRTGHTTNDELYEYIVVHNTRPPLYMDEREYEGEDYPTLLSYDGTPFTLDWVLGFGVSRDTALVNASINWRYDPHKRKLALEGTS